MHRTSIFISLIAVAWLAADGAEIPQGAHVLLRMENSINTRTAQEGDFVYLRTASPISVGGQIAAPSGSYVQGVVTESKRSGRVKGRAQLAIRLESLTLESGKVFKFSPHLSSVDSGETGQKVSGRENAIEQAPDTGKDAQRIAIWAGSGAALGGLTDRSWKGAGIGAGAGSAVGLATVLLTRGKEVELRHGATLDVVFDRPVALE
jgi:type IV secretion system protein VirB10